MTTTPQEYQPKKNVEFDFHNNVVSDLLSLKEDARIGEIFTALKGLNKPSGTASTDIGKWLRSTKKTIDMMKSISFRSNHIKEKVEVHGIKLYDTINEPTDNNGQFLIAYPDMSDSQVGKSALIYQRRNKAGNIELQHAWILDDTMNYQYNHLLSQGTTTEGNQWNQILINHLPKKITAANILDGLISAYEE